MTSSDLERRAAIGQIFQSDLFHYARTVLSRATKFGRITREEGRISMDQPRPCRNGRRCSAHQFWRFPSINAYTLWHRTTKFGVVTHTGRCVF